MEIVSREELEDGARNSFSGVSSFSLILKQEEEESSQDYFVTVFKIHHHAFHVIAIIILGA